MRKISISLAVVVFVVVSMFDLHAASLAGVTLPETVQVGGTALMLNGLGLRTKFVVKVLRSGALPGAEVVGSRRYSQGRRA